MSMIETAPPAQVRYAQGAMQQLREAMRHLPLEEKEVFVLRQNGQLPYEEIAQLYTRSVEVVKDQMRSALRKLRTVFQEVPSG
jgi:RNA polymerase sigma-70 factor (ECF subfamily)